ncbi:DNA repair metallo-beta-lactamase-domain-containing protein [Gilbertella persicaria]|uniref:DNA repair metallo-beta-lactamase-domain-containing protein n=1 Tax=Gilbertella persicaria TaxID=101096 RepID=UPI00221F9EF5|nr:DNA repair metallo-beta-lactamase-domain-containing protein [Gilbertella persicaria]KAI8098392.1 DNA repair metallo-beta-lactamase-domain-containing protein [Gilbertella persicaria]
MNKQKRKEPAVKSSYFSIDSYFKAPNDSNKRVKTDSTKEEQCPICNAFILVESISMEVHVNSCLDLQEKESLNNQEKKSLLLRKDLTVIKDSTIAKDSHQIQETPKEKKKTCPFYKFMRGTRFVVDAFKYGKIPDCDGYFLTHYHSDHFGGLGPNWSHGPIYCSQVTANLVKQELRVKPCYVHPLSMDTLLPIPNSTIQVALIDANHCPGSVLFLFVIDGKTRHLHTGDFRATPRMCLHPLIRQPQNPPLHSVYLDTTYMNPQYAFPAQEECIQAVCDVVSNHNKNKTPSLLEKWIKSPVKKKKPLIVVGTYTIGKERVFINVAKMLQCKIYAPSKKKRILLCQQDDQLKAMLTNNPHEAQVHIVPLGDIRPPAMFEYLRHYQDTFDHLIGFKPTGWTYRSTKTEASDMTLAPLFHIITPPSDRSMRLSPYFEDTNIQLFNVPYSEHSSFRELASFIASLEIQDIIPTVNLHHIDRMKMYFEKWQEEKRCKRIEVVAHSNQDHW